ncbi:MAG: hypothetical protein ACI38Q_08705 [Candidatus Bruticola sp.]
MLYFIGFIVFVVVAAVAYATINTYSYMGDLEHNLGFTKSKTSLDGFSVKVVGVYRNINTSVQAFVNFTPWKANNNRIIFTLSHRSSFNASITPGAGLAAKDLQEKQRIAKEESAKKVWNPKLTQEERSIIEERSKTRGDDEPVVQEELKILTASSREVDHFLSLEGRREVLANLFRNGVSSVEISRSDVSMEITNGTVEDLKSGNIDKNLKELQKFIVQKLEI